jgi:hypothetical protein
VPVLKQILDGHDEDRWYVDPLGAVSRACHVEADDREDHAAVKLNLMQCAPRLAALDLEWDHPEQVLGRSFEVE